MHRFTALIADACCCGEPEPAVGLYDQALELWRGDPFVDFAGEPWTTVEAARVIELRLSAIAERAERLITLGRCEQVVADLEPEVAETPTRERLVGQLMIGLFNAGRQAQALEVFARTRRVLADELGIDPSRDLRGVMQSILRQDPAMTPAPAAPRAAAGADRAALPRPQGELPWQRRARGTAFRPSQGRHFASQPGNATDATTRAHRCCGDGIGDQVVVPIRPKSQWLARR